MVHLSMLRLIRSNIIQQISHTSISLRHTPILDRQVRSFEIRIRPLWKMAIFEILDREGIGEDCFFFEIADEAMTSARGEEVAEEKRN